MFRIIRILRRHSSHSMDTIFMRGAKFFLPCEKNFVSLQRHSKIKKRMSTADISKSIAEYLATQPVTKAWLFGSYARGEQREDSDVDLLVEFDRAHAKVGLLKYAAIIIDLEKMLNREVDLVETGALLPWAEETANRDKKLIYERA